jgi:hypothetical protein
VEIPIKEMVNIKQNKWNVRMCISRFLWS